MRPQCIYSVVYHVYISIIEARNKEASKITNSVIITKARNVTLITVCNNHTNMEYTLAREIAGILTYHTNTKLYVTEWQQCVQYYPRAINCYEHSLS